MPSFTNVSRFNPKFHLQNETDVENVPHQQETPKQCVPPFAQLYFGHFKSWFDRNSLGSLSPAYKIADEIPAKFVYDVKEKEWKNKIVKVPDELNQSIGQAQQIKLLFKYLFKGDGSTSQRKRIKICHETYD